MLQSMFQMFLCNISDKKGNQKRRKDRLFDAIFGNTINHSENRVVFCIVGAAEDGVYGGGFNPRLEKPYSSAIFYLEAE